MTLQIVIKGWYEKPDFNNRFAIEWPHYGVVPRIGEYIDIREFRDDPKMDETYSVMNVQYGSEITVILQPLK